MVIDLQSWTDHFSAYYVTYLSLLACIIPILYLTKGYSLPLIQYLIELAIYSSIMHLFIGGVVRVAFWFREESTVRSFNAGERPDPWTTPWIEFWDTEAYQPYWILYLEIALVLIIFGLVLRYRPMKIQYKTKRQKHREAAEEQRRNRARYMSYTEDDF